MHERAFPPYKESEVGFHPINRQPGVETPDHWGNIRPNMPTCPYYELLIKCAKLIGISSDALANRNRFCGQTAYYQDTLKSISGYKGMIYEPVATCSEIHDLLKRTCLVSKELLEELRDKVTGDDVEDFYSGRFIKGALHCPQAPERIETGLRA